MDSKRGSLGSLAAAVTLLTIAGFARKYRLSAVGSESWWLDVLFQFAYDLGVILFFLAPVYWVAVEVFHLLRPGQRDTHNRLVSLSWFSLLAPFIALGLCFVVPSLLSALLQSLAITNIVLTRRYSFLGSSVIAAIVLLAHVRVKDWRQTWKPIVGLVFSGCLYGWTERFTNIF